MLETLGAAVVRGGQGIEARLSNAVIAIRPGPGGRSAWGRLIDFELAPRGATGADRTSPGEPALVGVGWASVDLERAADALRVRFEGWDRDTQLTRDLVDEALGARARVVGLMPGSVVRLALLEPATEGRLAATLAANGEGPAALYLAITGLINQTCSAPSATTDRSAGVGPFGRQRLVSGPSEGPHLLWLEPDVALSSDPSSTISP